jgi:elongation factor Ts
MADFTAKDVQRLRQVSGAGMMDAKKALTETDGDFDAALRYLHEHGLAATAKRADREASQGAVALGTAGRTAALVELKSETDFVAKSPDFTKLAQDLADAVAADGEGAIDTLRARVDELKITLKENIDVGRVVRFEPAEGNLIDTYLHIQADHGVNGVLVELEGGTQELAHDIAVHIAFAKPRTMTRDEVPEAEVADQRALLEAATRNEGKPEQALPKIVEGKLTGWFKRVPDGALLEQPFAKDEKQSVQQVLGGAKIARFAQVVIGS